MIPLVVGVTENVDSKLFSDPNCCVYCDKDEVEVRSVGSHVSMSYSSTSFARLGGRNFRTETGRSYLFPVSSSSEDSSVAVPACTTCCGSALFFRPLLLLRWGWLMLLLLLCGVVMERRL
jgi:hypothetical protein